MRTIRTAAQMMMPANEAPTRITASLAWTRSAASAEEAADLGNRIAAAANRLVTPIGSKTRSATLHVSQLL